MISVLGKDVSKINIGNREVQVVSFGDTTVWRANLVEITFTQAFVEFLHTVPVNYQVRTTQAFVEFLTIG